MPSVLYECRDFVLIDKPHNMPTVPLKKQKMEGTLLEFVANLFPDILDVTAKNPWEYGTLHRLDTSTSGMVLFARTQSAYDYLTSIQAEDLMEKTYMAETMQDERLKSREKQEGPSYRIMSYFRSYGKGSKEVRPTEDIRKADSPLLYTTLVRETGDSMCECTITRGFRHQIRAHLAWVGTPIRGDSVYGSAEEGEVLCLDCFSIRFPLENGKAFSFAKNADNAKILS